ncbi:MAG: acyltransferase [Eubacterium sp.]|nr:acyltransferase [Eubacterium sp.]
MAENIKKTKRNPSIELLRILMMLQIIFLHVSDYGQYSDIAQEMEGRTELTYWIIWLMCRCPVYMFVIITGYFVSTEKKFFDFKKIVKCYLPMLFYSISIPVIYGILMPGSVNTDQYIKAFLPFLSRTWYFMTLYLLILIISPFLNKMVENLTRTQFLYLICICFFLFSIWQPISMLEPFEGIIGIKKILSTQGGKSLYDFIYMYLLGAYMRRYHIFKRHETDKNSVWDKPAVYLAAFLFLGLINVLIVYLYPDEGIESVVGYNDNPLAVLQCTVLFRFFEKLDMSRLPRLGNIINYISAGNLGIYMIHEHPLIRNLIWYDIFKTGDASFYTQRFYILYIFLIILVVYSVCWIIDFIRRLLWLGIKKLINSAANNDKRKVQK